MSRGAIGVVVFLVASIFGNIVASGSHPEGTSTGANVKQAETTTSKQTPQEKTQPTQFASILDDEMIGAINGQPVFASELFQEFHQAINRAKTRAKAEELSPKVIDSIRMQLIRVHSKDYCSKKLLAQAFESNLNEGQRQRVDDTLEKMFDDLVEKYKKEYRVNTRDEVERELQKEGTSIAVLKGVFRMQAMAVDEHCRRWKSNTCPNSDESTKFLLAPKEESITLRAIMTKDGSEVEITKGSSRITMPIAKITTSHGGVLEIRALGDVLETVATYPQKVLTFHCEALKLTTNDQEVLIARTIAD